MRTNARNVKPIWSILICSLQSRTHYLEQLKLTLSPQVNAAGGLVIVTECIDNGELLIGAKRNKMVNECKTEYSSFIDDDDMVSHTYVLDHLKILTQAPNIDAIGFKGLITTDGRKGQYFYHHSKYQVWEQKHGEYYRPINHLNLVKNAYRKVVPFPEINHGEDFDQSLKMAHLIKTCGFIENTTYFYQFRNGVSTTSPKTKKK